MGQGYRVIVLGATGGPSEHDISGYLLYSKENPNESIILDAGTILCGLQSAELKGNLQDFDFEEDMLKPHGEVFLKKVKGYLISHAHLDHITGLVINSQVDGPNKFIAATDSTIDDIKTHVFNNVIWPNYGSEGADPILGRYNYLRMPLHEMVSLPHTEFKVEAHRLSHPHDYPSTAFIIERKGSYVVYFGDTSPDALEKEKHLAHIWKRIAPLIQEKKMSGLFLECSVPIGNSDQVIYGHLNPKLMMQEFHELAKIAGSLKGLKVIVSHRKGSLYKKENFELIVKQLDEANDLGLNFIFPIQGELIVLDSFS